MAYNAQDKLEMTMRQARVDIGQGRGNAMTNAIQFVLGTIPEGYPTDDKEREKMILFAFELSDKIFHYQQVKIESDYQSWEAANLDKIKAELGLIEPVIQEEQAL